MDLLSESNVKIFRHHLYGCHFFEQLFSPKLSFYRLSVPRPTRDTNVAAAAPHR